jgi:DNA-binding response OmpR family regulator
MLNGAQATILLVEPDAVMRRLLALGLRQQGMCVIEASALDATSARQLPHADLLLIDVDNSFANDYLLFNEIREHLLSDTLPIVALAWETPALIPALVDGDDRVTVLERVAYVAKPFDARALYSTISDLLAATISRETAQPQLATLSASSRSSMSILPLITAVGLLILIIGFMLQIAISAVGLLIVLIALLWWTLGTGNRLVGA